jgi:iron complex outermembrane receptor protein
MKSWPYLLLATVAVEALATSLDDELAAETIGLETPFALATELPVVLSASRLRQARADAPASVTVIEAEQIAAWGVRTIPELMRFVPGMFIGHSDGDNNASVTYHAGNPNLTRRMQVLVDGRSAIRPGIAAVVWDDLAVALEDIQRIEVIRGPNSATYGTNAFVGVINIITRHPADSVGTRLRYQAGNQATRGAFASHAGVGELSSYRISANFNSDDGFDGRTTGEDDFRDGRRHGFVTGYYHRQLTPMTQLNLQASLKRGTSEMHINEGDDPWQDPPDQHVNQQYVLGHLQFDHSAEHSSSLRAYWQRNDRQVDSRACVPSIGFDPGLFTLYQQNPAWVETVFAGDQQLLGLLLSGAATPEQIEQLTGVAVTQPQVEQVLAVLGRAIDPSDPSTLANLEEESCGLVNWDINEQRYDVEWQDTYVWSDTLRTVIGANLRRDQANSETYYNGYVKNDTYRLFASGEWRFAKRWLLNVGATYESEDTNDNVLSPRLALNWQVQPQHSLRFVASQAVRSPDLLEQEPEYSLTARDLTDNYLGLDQGTYFLNQTPGSRQLDHEKITSWELGYYGNFAQYGIEVDLKLHRTFQTQLISDPINLQTTNVRSDTEMRVQGADLQINWQISPRNQLWLVSAYVDADVTLGDTSGLTSKDIRDLQRVELRASARDSVVASWIHTADDWRFAVSHFWADAYGDAADLDQRYRRYEVNINRHWQLGRYRPYLGVFWHHLIDDSSLVYLRQRYEVNDIYFLRLGLEF